MFFTGRLRGMQDLLPPQSDFYSKVELLMRSRAEFRGFSFVRTPVLEFTELFNRSAGDFSDVVQKEMYTFKDKSDRSITLRPEFTAGVLRAVVNGFSDNAVLPLKLVYFGPCYRYERPQTGRYREFFQFGAEIFGSPSVLADVELISLASDIFFMLGLKNIKLELNAVGCKNCRNKYIDSIKGFFWDVSHNFCDTCKSRLHTNPLRIFDCKNETCKKVFEKAPHTVDFICDDCLKDFEELKKYLEIIGIDFVVNTRVVRGLDYYTRFVFEFVADFDNNSLTICGGGRYDNLSENLGGPYLPATGFGIGFERLIFLLQKISGENAFSSDKLKIYFVYVSEEAKAISVKIAFKLRNAGISCDFDIVGRSVKSQMKYANKMKYDFVVVIGNNELESGCAKLKNMSDGSEIHFSLSNFHVDILNYLKKFQ